MSGSYCAVVNYDGDSQNGNTLTQTTTASSSDVQADGKVHVQFAWAAVVENPDHTDTEQPYVYVAATDLTKDTVLYQSFIFAGNDSIWHTAANSVQYTDWQVLDIAPDSSALAVGDQVQIEVTAVGCALGGHWGYVYVDHFGSFQPVTPSVTVANKTYDGTTSATITGRSLSGVQNTDDVSLSGGTATFGAASPGLGKTVTVTGLTLSGTDADKYMLTSYSATTTADIVGAPSVSSAALSGLGATSASSGGNVTSDGCSTVTARGVCWSTSANPTIADSHTTDGTGTGAFTSSLTGLTSTTTYHVRAYATNAVGTSYGPDVYATTLCSVSFASDGTTGATLSGDTSQSVAPGGGATAVTANAPTGYHFINWALSDGSSSTDNPLTLTSVEGNMVATATFGVDTFTISANAEAHGHISPSGVASVDYGASQNFTITADAHYRIADVVVDGTSLGAVTSHVFSDVTGAHTIAASFLPTDPPLTSVKGLPHGWVRRDVSLTLAATHTVYGAPVAFTQYRIGSGPWTQGTAVTVAQRGATTVQYRSIDTVGNIEATHTCRVRIDRTAPVVRDGGEVNVFRGSTARFSYRVGEISRARYAAAWRSRGTARWLS